MGLNYCVADSASLCFATTMVSLFLICVVLFAVVFSGVLIDEHP